MSTLQTGSPVHHRYVRRVGDRQTSCAPHPSRTCNVRAPRSRRHARVQRVCSFVEGEAHVRTDPSNRRLGGAVVRVGVRAPVTCASPGSVSASRQCSSTDRSPRGTEVVQVVPSGHQNAKANLIPTPESRRSSDEESQPTHARRHSADSPATRKAHRPCVRDDRAPVAPPAPKADGKNMLRAMGKASDVNMNQNAVDGSRVR